ncbi:MAG TPA: hypothetical protein VM144_10930 [Aestuariivirga sp.]|nr:hypothetical protein [Aestuariivirga sp.]
MINDIINNLRAKGTISFLRRSLAMENSVIAKYRDYASECRVTAADTPNSATKAYWVREANEWLELARQVEETDSQWRILMPHLIR